MKLTETVGSFSWGKNEKVEGDASLKIGQGWDGVGYKQMGKDSLLNEKARGM